MYTQVYIHIMIQINKLLRHLKENYDILSRKSWLELSRDEQFKYTTYNISYRNPIDITKNIVYVPDFVEIYICASRAYHLLH